MAFRGSPWTWLIQDAGLLCRKGSAWVVATGLIIEMLIVASVLYLLDVILSHTKFYHVTYLCQWSVLVCMRPDSFYTPWNWPPTLEKWVIPLTKEWSHRERPHRGRWMAAWTSQLPENCSHRHWPSLGHVGPTYVTFRTCIFYYCSLPPSVEIACTQ